MEKVHWLKGRIERLKYLSGLIENPTAKKGMGALIHELEDRLFSAERERLLVTIAEISQKRNSYDRIEPWVAMYEEFEAARQRQLEGRR